MSTDQISNKMANLKPQKVVIPKVWKRPHSTIYGKNVEFGSKLTSDKLGEINGRKFNSELPWTMRNSGGASSTSGSSTSQGYLSTLLNEPQSTLIGSVITSKPTDRTSSYLLPSADRERDESDAREPTRLTANNCTNYADVLELTNPNRYSKRRAEQARDRERNLRLRTMHDNNSRKTTAAPNKAKRIDFYENYLDFNNEIRRMNESSRLMNDPLMQRRSFDRHLDFNYELGLFVPVSSSSDDGRSLLSKKTLKGALESSNNSWLPEDELKQSQWRQYQTVAATNTKQAGGDDTPRPTGVNSGGHNRRQHDSFEHQSDINPAHFNPVITTTKQTPMLPKHACQLSDSPYGQSADGRKLSLGSINPHSYRPSLPHKTTTVHSSDGEEFEFQDKSSPFYTDGWAGRTIRHFDSDLYSNANLFKSMIL